jgi:hypothetical protein
MHIFLQKVLRQLALTHGSISEFDHARGNLTQFGNSGGAEPARTGDNLILTLIDTANKQRLQHSLAFETRS